MEPVLSRIAEVDIGCGTYEADLRSAERKGDGANRGRNFAIGTRVFVQAW